MLNGQQQFLLIEFHFQEAQKVEKNHFLFTFFKQLNNFTDCILIMIVAHFNLIDLTSIYFIFHQFSKHQSQFIKLKVIQPSSGSAVR